MAKQEERGIFRMWTLEQCPQCSAHNSTWICECVSDCVSGVLCEMGQPPVVACVSDASVAPQPVALLQVEGVFSIGIIPRLQLLPR